LILFSIGIISFVIPEILWIWIFNDLYASKWILEPTLGIILSLLVIVISGTYFGHRYIRGTIEVVSYLLGFWVAIPIMLFIIGPGNLWPIVLIIDYIIVTPAALLVSLLGFGLAQKTRGKKST